LLRTVIADLLEKTIADYPLDPAGQWWAPERLGGLAPSPTEAKRMDVEEYAARAAKKAAREAAKAE